MQPLIALAHGIDWINDRFGSIAKWAVFLACAISAGNAFIRYGLDISSNGWLEIQWYLFAACVMLGASQVLRLNEHVRVDLFYGKLSSRGRVWVDLLGLCFFLLPAMAVLLYFSWPMFVNMFVTKEMSSNAGGLIRWPAMLLLPLGFGLLLGAWLGLGSPPDTPAEQFASWLPYSAYLADEKLFVNRDSLGFMLELMPQSGADDRMAEVLISLYSTCPPGTGIQFHLYASPAIRAPLARYANLRLADDVVPELDTLGRAVQRILLHFQQQHGNAGIEEIHGDATPHGARTDHSHMLNVSYGGRSGHIFDLGCRTFRQKQMAKCCTFR